MKVAKWGNSLAVRIPADVAETLGLMEGDEVELTAGEASAIVVNRLQTREEAVRSLRRFRGTMPVDYRFDRDEANGR